MESLPELIPTLIHDPETHTLSLQPHPVPALAPSHTAHLIRIHAVALTSQELAWPEPQAAEPAPVPGYEVAGVVVRAPAGSPFGVGSEVVALTAFDRPGNARKYGLALTGELGQRPRGLGWAEAATVPLSGLTAWQALFVHGALAGPAVEDGVRCHQRQNLQKRVLVTAAAGGVGLFAVQLAKLAGAYVVGTCGKSNLDFVSALGADEVLDYRVTDLRAWVAEDGRGTAGGKKFDLVLDGVGGKTLEQAWATVREGGTIISVAEPAEGKRPAEAVAEGVRSKWFIVEPDGKQLGGITRLLEEERCKAVFDSVFKLDEYEKAFDKVRSGHVRGKVVLSVED